MIRVCAKSQARASRSSTSPIRSAPGPRRAARGGGCSRSPSTRATRERALLRLLHRPRRRQLRRRVQARAARRRCERAESLRKVLEIPHRRPPTTTAAAPVRPRRQALDRAPATVAAAAIRPTTRRTRHAARQAAADRPPPARGATATDGQPVRRPPRRDEIYASVCATRGASRSTRDGDLAIGDVGTGRRARRSTSEPASARGSNFGWPAFEGFPPRRSDAAPARPADRRRSSSTEQRHGRCAVTGGYVVRDRALPRCTAATSTPTSASGIRSLVARAVAAAPARRPRRPRRGLYQRSRRPSAGPRRPRLRRLAATAPSSGSIPRETALLWRRWRSSGRALERGRRRRGQDRGRRRDRETGAAQAAAAAARSAPSTSPSTSTGRRAPKLLFVVEQPGTIRLAARGQDARPPFLDIRDRVQLRRRAGPALGRVRPRTTRRTGRFYVYYTERGGDIEVDEFRRSARRHPRRARSPRRR